MKEEKSCGAVVVRSLDGQIEYLVEKMKGGHYSLPKGHVLAGETEFDTARREIKEETNLDVIFYHGFRQVISYFPTEGVEKEVVFFMAETYDITKMKPQIDEVSELFFLPYSQAVEMMTFDTDKKILRQAQKFSGGYGDEEVFH